MRRPSDGTSGRDVEEGRRHATDSWTKPRLRSARRSLPCPKATRFIVWLRGSAPSSGSDVAGVLAASTRARHGRRRRGRRPTARSGRGGRQAPPAALRGRRHDSQPPADERALAGRAPIGCDARWSALARPSGGRARGDAVERPRADARPPGRSAARPGPARRATDPAAVAARSVAAERRRLLGEALQDQRLVAGIGNMWMSETLWAAGLSPWLARRRGERRRVARRAAVGADGDACRGRGPRPGRSVYRRAGRPCRRCGAVIRSRGQGDDNRTAYWCPGCQRGPDRRLHDRRSGSERVDGGVAPRAPQLHASLRGFVLGAFAYLLRELDDGAELPVAFVEHEHAGGPALYEYRPLVRAFVEERAPRLRGRDDALIALEELQREPAAGIFARAHAGPRPSEDEALFRTVLAGPARRRPPRRAAASTGTTNRSIVPTPSSSARSSASVEPIRRSHRSSASRCRRSSSSRPGCGSGRSRTASSLVTGPRPARSCRRTSVARPIATAFSSSGPRSPGAEDPPDAPAEIADAVSAIRLATAAPLSAGPVLFETLDGRPFGIRPVLPIAATQPPGEPTPARLVPRGARGRVARSASPWPTPTARWPRHSTAGSCRSSRTSRSAPSRCAPRSLRSSVRRGPCVPPSCWRPSRMSRRRSMSELIGLAGGDAARGRWPTRHGVRSSRRSSTAIGGAPAGARRGPPRRSRTGGRSSSPSEPLDVAPARGGFSRSSRRPRRCRHEHGAEVDTETARTRHSCSSLRVMEEARRVIERLERIEALDRSTADPAELLAELRGLLRDAEAWVRVEGGESARRRRDAPARRARARRRAAPEQTTRYPPERPTVDGGPARRSRHDEERPGNRLG